MKQLKERFFTSVSPLKYFLLMIGIDWNPCGFKIGRILLKSWCILCLIIDVATSIYFFQSRSKAEITNLLVDGKMEPPLLSLMRFIDRLNKVTCNIVTHSILFFSLKNVFGEFLDRLESVDSSLRHPNLSSFKRFSLFSIVWTLLLVTASTVFIVANYNITAINILDFNSLDPYFCLDVLQSIIVAQCRLIPSVSAFIFYIGSELTIIYYRRIFESLKYLMNSEEIGRSMQDHTFKRITFLVKNVFIIKEAARFLQNGMQWLLFTNCCFVFINTFINIFYIFHGLIDGWKSYFDMTGFHMINIIETAVRFFLFCHASDRLNFTPFNFALKLRELRGEQDFLKLTSMERTKITLLIVEHFDVSTKPEYTGLTGLSKDLFVPLTDLTMTFLCILLEFQFGTTQSSLVSFID